jgi:hypothetical protein
LPTLNPDAIVSGSVMALMTVVANERKFLMMKPPRMHLISDIPEPAA